MKPSSLEQALGHAPEELPLPLREELTGHWAAFELYDTRRLPDRKIAAIGDSPQDCYRQLSARGLDPALFEITILQAPY